MKSYNQAMASFSSRVLVSARKMKELGAGTSKELPDAEAVERGRGWSSGSVLPDGILRDLQGTDVA
mgnify:CR=1 FL=1